MQECNPQQGLPRPRKQWVANREVAGDVTPTQMYYAKQGIITEEMAFVAAREEMPVEFVRSEVFGPGYLLPMHDVMPTNTCVTSLLFR